MTLERLYCNAVIDYITIHSRDSYSVITNTRSTQSYPNNPVMNSAYQRLTACGGGLLGKLSGSFSGAGTGAYSGVADDVSVDYNELTDGQLYIDLFNFCHYYTAQTDPIPIVPQQPKHAAVSVSKGKPKSPLVDVGVNLDNNCSSPGVCWGIFSADSPHYLLTCSDSFILEFPTIKANMTIINLTPSNPAIGRTDHSLTTLALGNHTNSSIYSKNTIANNKACLVQIQQLRKSTSILTNNAVTNLNNTHLIMSLLCSQTNTFSSTAFYTSSMIMWII